MTPDDTAEARAKGFVDKMLADKPTSRLPAEIRQQILAEFPEIRRFD